MKKWEHKIVKFSTGMALIGSNLNEASIKEQQQELNDLGQDGWQVISIATESRNGFTNGVIYALRRELAGT